MECRYRVACALHRRECIHERCMIGARIGEHLLDAGYVVRETGPSYGIDNGLRISIGSEQAMRAVARVLKSMDEAQ